MDQSSPERKDSVELMESPPYSSSVSQHISPPSDDPVVLAVHEAQATSSQTASPTNVKQPAPEQVDLALLEETKRRKKTKRLMWRIFKLAALIGVIFLIAYAGNLVSKWINSIRFKIASYPPAAVIIVVILSSFPRKLVPPLYFIFPVGTIFLLYCGDYFGAEMGALVSQLVQLHDIFFYYLLDRYFTKPIQRALDGERVKYVSEDFRKAIVVVDHTWLEKVTTSPFWKRAGILICWNLSLYMDNYVTLFWWATRSKVGLLEFSGILILSQALGYPKALIKIRALQTSASSIGSISSFLKGLGHLAQSSWWEIIFIFLLIGAATLVVHGTHAWLILKTAWIKFNEPPPSPEQLEKQEEEEEKELDALVGEDPLPASGNAPNSPDSGNSAISNDSGGNSYHQPLDSPSNHS